MSTIHYVQLSRHLSTNSQHQLNWCGDINRAKVSLSLHTIICGTFIIYHIVKNALVNCLPVDENQASYTSKARTLFGNFRNTRVQYIMEQSKGTGAATRSRGFHKKGSKVTQIPGTKPSIHNNTLLTSSGVPSLDALIGNYNK